MRFFLVRLMLLSAILAGLLARPVHADSIIIVTTTSDAVADDGQCSLREAVIAANTDMAKGGCPAGSGADTIRFAAHLPPPAMVRMTGPLDLIGTLLLDGGTGARVVLDAQGSGGILHALAGARVDVNNFELRNAQETLGGAVVVQTSAWMTMTAVSIVDSRDRAVQLEGRLTVRDSFIGRNGVGIMASGGQVELKNTDLVDNLHDALNASFTSVRMEGGVVRGNGSGVATSYHTTQLSRVLVEGNRTTPVQNVAGTFVLADSTVRTNQGRGAGNFTANGRMTILRSRITGNTSADAGGVFNEGTMVIEDSTIDGNTGRAGGGLYHNGAALKLVNVTISGNAAADNGGGIYAQREMTLNYVTLAANTAGGEGGNLFVDQAQVAVTGSLFNHASGQTNCVNSAGKITSLAGNIADDVSCGFANTASDLMLGSLSDNGGATPTRALLRNSPAVDAGASSDCPPFDQRGVRRPQGAACDAGAYEAGGARVRLQLPMIRQ